MYAHRILRHPLLVLIITGLVVRQQKTGTNQVKAIPYLKLTVDSLASDTLARLRRNLGADLVVLGSYVALGREARGQVRVGLRLQDARPERRSGSSHSVDDWSLLL